MFYVGANDQRVTLVDDQGHQVYDTDFRSFTNILTHLRPLIRAIALANPSGEVDAKVVEALEEQMRREKSFHSITALSMAPLDSRFVALVALARAQGSAPARATKSARAKGRKK